MSNLLSSHVKLIVLITIKCRTVYCKVVSALFTAGLYLTLDAVSKITKRQCHNLIEYPEELKPETSYTWGTRVRFPMVSLELLLT
jgi:hypothetical protein